MNKTIFFYILFMFILGSVVMMMGFKPASNGMNGAWQMTSGTNEYSLIAADNYCMVAQYDKANKKFIQTFGGPCELKGKKLSIVVQFNTSDKNTIGKTVEYAWDAKTATANSNISGANDNWRMVDNGTGNLAGNWRIVQRKNGGQLSDIPLRARRTLKLLTASRFQWAAINIETGEFSGTGGGTYTFSKGKYTEHIEFFSRDSSRVGAALSFDAKIENGNWIHSGLSSKGDPIYEIWGRMK